MPRKQTPLEIRIENEELRLQSMERECGNIDSLQCLLHRKRYDVLNLKLERITSLLIPSREK